MRAVRCHALGGPSSLQVDALDDPTPGAGEVAIDVRAAGVNFPEVLLSYGKYQFKPPTPFIPGGELAGVVAAVGEGVTSLRVGDRVAATMIHGAFAERVVAPELSAVPLPEGVSFEVGAITLLTYATTWHALVDRAAIQPGETLLVLGASGGVGVAAIQVGKLLGARVIAAASSPEKLAFCREMGADEVVCYATEDLKERVKSLTGAAGANVVYDPVGGAYADPALRAIAWEGRYLVVGFASGEIPRVPLNLTLLKGCQIVGVFWGSFAAREPEKNRANCAEIFAHVAAGRLAPHLDATFSFERAGDALRRLEARAVRGKVALVP
ncbi:MAG: NADPH:quinone oxidoreductase family protein [Polyangiales bacterium]